MFVQGGPGSVFLATRPVDFRKGSEEGQKTVRWTVFPTNGLALAVQEMFGLDPFCGAVFVFRSKRADRIKLLVWDQTGMVFGAVLEPVAHTPLTSQATGGRQVRLAPVAGRGDEDVQRADVGVARRAGLATGPAGAYAASTGSRMIGKICRIPLFLLVEWGVL